MLEEINHCEAKLQEAKQRGAYPAVVEQLEKDLNEVKKERSNQDFDTHKRFGAIGIQQIIQMIMAVLAAIAPFAPKEQPKTANQAKQQPGDSSVPRQGEPAGAAFAQGEGDTAPGPGREKAVE